MKNLMPYHANISIICMIEQLKSNYLCLHRIKMKKSWETLYIKKKQLKNERKNEPLIYNVYKSIII